MNRHFLAALFVLGVLGCASNPIISASRPVTEAEFRSARQLPKGEGLEIELTKCLATLDDAVVWTWEAVSASSERLEMVFGVALAGVVVEYVRVDVEKGRNEVSVSSHDLLNGNPGAPERFSEGLRNLGQRPAECAVLTYGELSGARAFVNVGSDIAVLEVAAPTSD